MQFLMFLVIPVSTLAVYLSSQDGVHWLPSVAKFLPEAFSLITAFLVVVLGVHQNFRFVSGKYLLIFAALAVVMLCGILVNQVPPGPTLAGMRYYLRALPFFLVPAVFDFRDRQLKPLMMLILGLSLLQVPIACYQRYELATHGLFTGDLVFGTLMQSGFLSIFLICELCVLAAMVIRGAMSKFTFACLFLLFVLAMSINETKVTVFVLPLGLLVTAIVGAPRSKRLSVTAYALLLVVIGGFIFVPLYDFFNTWNNNEAPPLRIENFLSDPGQMASYLDTHATVGSHKEAGRVDAIVVPLQVLAKDPSRFGFGLGLGNASKSALGSQFSGRYQPVYGEYSLETSMATFMLETGIFGAMLILFLHFMIFLDAVDVMRRDNGLTGIVALGWIGTSIVIGASLFYITIHISETVSYVFWFFSGVIAARRTRMALAQRASHVQAVAAGELQG
jgi:hypothetical protein